MSAIGGSIVSVSIRGRTFPVAADADAGIKLGGKEVERQANGDGKTGRKVMTQVSWSISDVALSIDEDRDDLQFLQEVADDTDDVPITIELADGAVYQGKGSIEGEIKKQTQNATAPLGFSGNGQLTKQ